MAGGTAGPRPRRGWSSCTGSAGGGELAHSTPAMSGCPGSQQVPDFSLLPIRWREAAQPSPACTRDIAQVHGVAPGLQAMKCRWDLGRQPTHTSTTSLTCCDPHWTPGHLHANHPLSPCQQHCHQELQAQSIIQPLHLLPCIPKTLCLVD